MSLCQHEKTPACSLSPTNVSVDPVGFLQEPLNVLAFFDNSGGEGKVPEKVAELPVEYPRHKGHPVGFTGGLRAGNVKEWLVLVITHVDRAIFCFFCLKLRFDTCTK